jgi:hypothetical protein
MSAPSERVFSVAGNIVNKKRVRLKPDTVDLLIFLRANKEFISWDSLLSRSLGSFCRLLAPIWLHVVNNKQPI